MPFASSNGWSSLLATPIGDRRRRSKRSAPAFGKMPNGDRTTVQSGKPSSSTSPVDGNCRASLPFYSFDNATQRDREEKLWKRLGCLSRFPLLTTRETQG